MQPGGPYQFIEAVGRCQVGSVWSAVDGQGRSLTVAVLDAGAASDQRWRDAFAATANSLAQPAAGGTGYLHADFSAPAPWVAYAADDGPGAERIFLALGMDYRPMPAAADQATAAATEPPEVGHTAGGPTSSMASAEDPLSTERLNPGTAPVNPWEAGQPQPVSPPLSVSAPPQIISVPPDPVSGMPASPGGGPFPPAGPSSYDLVYSPPPSYDPFSSSVRHIVPSEPRRRRTGLWIGIGVLVVVVLAGGGSVFALTNMGADGTPTSTPPSGASSASSLPPAPLPTGAPLQPGLEPPKPGVWPAEWPKFAETDRVRTLTNLDGLGFRVKVPQDWQCIPGGRANGFAKYHCGVSPGEDPEVGGELIVRDCPESCSGGQQRAMRKAEEAWGLQWISIGRYSTYAESSSLQVDGAQRYGLVVVAYWRGGSEGAIDRQLVIRMTAPVEKANQLRRVANYIRDAVIF